MEESIKKPGSVRTGLLAYREETAQNLAQYLKKAQLSNLLELQSYNLRDLNGFNCDMALAIFNSGDDLKEYTNALAKLKLVSKIPMVVALVLNEAKDLIEPNAAEIAADKIVYLPLRPGELAKVIKKGIATIRKKQTMPGFRRTGAHKLLGSILVEEKVITPIQLKQALDHQLQNKGIKLGEALIQLGALDEQQLVQYLAQQLRVPMATPKQYASADMNVVALIPELTARTYTCIALKQKGKTIQVAMLDVNNLRLLDILRDQTECTIQPILGTKTEIETSIKRYYADIVSHKDASNLMAEMSEDIEIVQAEEEGVDLEQAAAEGAELGIIKLVNMFIGNAIRDKASDIHVEPMEHTLSVRYRVDGVLRPLMSPPKRSHQAIVTRIKILSNLDIAERRLPQDGRMVVKINNREVDMRVSILPTIFGEKVVMRLLDKEAFEKSTTNLGFTEHEQEIFKDQVAKPYGMIVVTGPTGSGKSTTLYSALQTVKSPETNIITVEDPVEFHMEGINQVHVNSDIGLTFGAALRSILRQDPDTILIGEIRDGETADIAIKMALTGHLVFSTLHTNDAASAVTRFVDIGIPPLLLASSLNLIIAQRLVRRICTQCKMEYKPDEGMLEELGLDISKMGDVKFYKGDGCVACHGTGCKGRVGLFEMLIISREIRALMLKGSSSIEIQDIAIKQGMQTLRQSGITKIMEGITTVEQVLAATTEL
jgi:type IV pilus assembly protein PilB